MLGFVVLASVAYFAFAHYGAQQPQYDPAPVQYGAAPPQPPVPIVITPIKLPEIPASHEILYPRDSHSHSHSHSHERRCEESCANLRFSCANADGECFRPRVDYDTRRKCPRAIVTCGRGEAALMTKNDEVLSYGMGIDIVLKCRRGRWTTDDIEGRRIKVSTVRCISYNNLNY